MALNRGASWRLSREFQDPQALADWEQKGLMLQAPMPVPPRPLQRTVTPLIVLVAPWTSC